MPSTTSVLEPICWIRALLVFLALEQNDSAKADLETSLDDSPSGIRFFHRARLHLQTKDRDAAKADVKKAQELGLKPAQIHPLERQASAEIMELFHE